MEVCGDVGPTRDRGPGASGRIPHIGADVETDGCSQNRINRNILISTFYLKAIKGICHICVIETNCVMGC